MHRMHLQKSKKVASRISPNVAVVIDIGHNSRLLELEEVQHGEVECLCKK